MRGSEIRYILKVRKSKIGDLGGSIRYTHRGMICRGDTYYMHNAASSFSSFAWPEIKEIWKRARFKKNTALRDKGDILHVIQKNQQNQLVSFDKWLN